MRPKAQTRDQITEALMAGRANSNHMALLGLEAAPPWQLETRQGSEINPHQPAGAFSQLPLWDRTPRIDLIRQVHVAQPSPLPPEMIQDPPQSAPPIPHLSGPPGRSPSHPSPGHMSPPPAPSRKTWLRVPSGTCPRQREERRWLLAGVGTPALLRKMPVPQGQAGTRHIMGSLWFSMKCP